MIDKLIHKPVAVTMIVIAVAVLGLIATLRMPVSLMPAIDVPRVTVSVSMPGYSAAEIEERIITPLRLQLQRVAGLKSLSSQASADAGTITLSFEPGSDTGPLFIDINEKVDMAMPSLPRDMERPRVVKANATDLPAFFIDISLKQDKGGENASARFASLSDFARNVVRRRLEQLPPVAMTDISGLTTPEIVCEPEAEKLEALGLSADDLSRALEERDVRLEALSVRDGVYRYSVHFDAGILSAGDVADARLNIEGRVLRIGDLCKVYEQPAPRHAVARHDGCNCITLAVIKQADARMGDLRQEVDGVLDELRKSYPDIAFDVTRDQTELLSYSIDNMEWNLLAAAAFTLLVLIVFMRQWRLALLVAVSIPLSLIATLLCISLLGMSLNVISLSGLILGVGMIVDNSIIVVDNTLQKRRAGMPLAQAASQGATEVFTPMLSSVLTTCSVFLPLILVGGLAGAMFFDQAMSVTIALFASLAVAMLVLPVWLFATASKSRHISSQQPVRFLKPMFCWYERTQKWMLRHTPLCLIASLLCIPGALLMYHVLDKRQLPAITRTDGMMHIDWNAGVPTEESDRRICQLMQGSFPDAHDTTRSYTSLCGTQDFLLAHTRDITPSEALVYLRCGSKASYDSAQFRLANTIAAKWPEATVSFAPSGNLFDLIFSTGEPDIELRLQTTSGHRPSVDEASALTDTLRRQFPMLDIQQMVTEDNLLLTADVEKMGIYKVSYDRLRSRLEQLTGANVVMRISRGAVSVPVIIGQSGVARGNLMDKTVKSDDGIDIPLGLLLTEHAGSDFKRLYASDGGEFFPIDIADAQGKSAQLLGFAKHYTSAHDGLRLTATGAYFSGRQLTNKLMGVLAVSVALLFLILAAQFESLVQPLIILSEIIIDMFLVMVVLLVTGQTLNVMSMTGLIVMAGVVINDSILKVDTINRHRHAGMPLLRAVAAAGRERLVPIIMTSLTTILAMLPFMRGGSMGADLQYPLSLAVITGMVVGTLVSIFYVPLVYYVIYKERRT